MDRPPTDDRFFKNAYRVCPVETLAIFDDKPKRVHIFEDPHFEVNWKRVHAKLKRPEKRQMTVIKGI